MTKFGAALSVILVWTIDSWAQLHPCQVSYLMALQQQTAYIEAVQRYRAWESQHTPTAYQQTRRPTPAPKMTEPVYLAPSTTSPPPQFPSDTPKFIVDREMERWRNRPAEPAQIRVFSKDVQVVIKKYRVKATDCYRILSWVDNNRLSIVHTAKLKYEADKQARAAKELGYRTPKSQAPRTNTEMLTRVHVDLLEVIDKYGISEEEAKRIKDWCKKEADHRAEVEMRRLGIK